MNTTDYQYHTKPFKHQDEIFHKTADLPYYALLWEQGVAKTKPTIDTAVYLHQKGEIDTMVVVAPNGVHRNWVTDEIPAHMPSGVTFHALAWESSKARTKQHSFRVRSLVYGNGLRILTISYDAMMTQLGLDAIVAMMKGHDTMLVFDESHKLKTPGAKRTKRAVAIAKRAKYRRLLTGTMIANSPFDAYSQFRCLDPGFWKPHGFSVFSTFKAHFGLFQKGYNAQQGREFETCVGYRRIDQLHDLIQPSSSRLTKDDTLDLPKKLYQRRFFEMTAEQSRVYKEIKNDALTLLASGEVVTAPLAITRLLRLQQVTCGYVPTDDGHGAFATFDRNPRLELLEEVCDDFPHPAIIWARFRRDIDLVMDMLGKKAVRYDGKTSSDERVAARTGFQAGDVQFFVSNPAVGGEGIKLTAAHMMVYASNSFNLTHRLQSEDRPHRIGLDHPLLIMDLIAPGTVDEHIVKALRSKLSIASEVTGDKLKEWI